MDKIKEFLDKKWVSKTLYILGLVILIVLCFDHVTVGVETTDTGYSLGNYTKFFTDSGTWVLATFLANLTGAVLTKMPFGSYMLGMQMYACIFLAAFVTWLYFYLPKHLNKSTTFVGLLLAVSLAWCPKIILYNYMTYYFFTIAAVLIYEAMLRKKDMLLFIAGVVLSLSMFVRFPNVCECLLIAPVIYGAVINKESTKAIMKKVGLSVGGFLSGVAVLSLVIMLIYGPSSYVAMIGSLFGMQSTDSSYSVVSMIRSILIYYKECIVVMGLLFVVCLAAGVLYTKVKNKYFSYILSALWVCFVCAYLLYMYKIGYFWRNYNDLTAVRMLITFFLVCSMIGYGFVMFSKKADMKERLLAAIAFTIIIVTPLGSNNALYPMYNNLFIVAPFSIYLLYKMIAKKDNKLFIVNVGATIILGVILVQSVLFGINFTFRGVGFAGELNSKVETGVLKGMYTTADKKAALEDIISYMSDTDKKTICYGQIPALNYYVESPSPLSSSWPDLNTVLSLDQMKEEMLNLEEKPVFLLTVQEEERLSQGVDLEDKEIFIKSYMEENGYTKLHSNEMFAVYDIIE